MSKLEMGDKIKIIDGFNALLTGKIGKVGKIKTEYKEILQPTTIRITNPPTVSTETRKVIITNYIYGIIFQELLPNGTDLDGSCIGNYGFWIPEDKIELIERMGKNPFRKGDIVKITNKADAFYGKEGPIEDIHRGIGYKYIIVKGCTRNKYYIWELELISKKIIKEEDLIL